MAAFTTARRRGDADDQPTKFTADGEGQIGLFWRAMNSISPSIADVVSRSFDFSVFRRLLDVGGGPGDLDVRLCERHPEPRATVFDLPPVCELTAARLREIGLDDRVDTVAGDLLAEEKLPAGYDLVTLVNVLHMWDPDVNEAILRKCHDALDHSGVLLIVEGFIADDGSGPIGPALMSLNMLVDTVGGRNYSRSEYESMLLRAGFATTERVPLVADLPLVANSEVIGRKSSAP
jgi:3-hydroxy-5-methyl-1-naphthoate 3-O-methyltransferase